MLLVCLVVLARPLVIVWSSSVVWSYAPLAGFPPPVALSIRFRLTSCHALREHARGTLRFTRAISQPEPAKAVQECYRHVSLGLGAWLCVALAHHEGAESLERDAACLGNVALHEGPPGWGKSKPVESAAWVSRQSAVAASLRHPSGEGSPPGTRGAP